jgi:methionyl-tRNA formyltransferase
LHASLLPKYRGAAPINWALYHGETETGVTVIHMTPQLDAGPAVAIGRLAIGTYDTAAEIEPRLAELGAPLVLQAMAALEAGTAAPIVQDSAQATKAPRLRKELGAIDWTRTAVAIKDQIRALQPWPKSFTFWQREGGEPIRLIVERVRLEPQQQGSPGTVLTAAGETLVIATGAGALAIEQIQPAGKRAMSAGEFLRGNPIRPGDRFIAR